MKNTKFGFFSFQSRILLYLMIALGTSAAFLLVYQENCETETVSSDTVNSMS